MLTPLKKFFTSKQEIFETLANAEDQETLDTNEILVLASIFSPILFIAAFVGSIVGILWEFSFLELLISFICLLFSSISIHIISRLPLKATIKLHLISLFTVLCLIDGYLLFYQHISLIFWFMLFTVTLLAVINTNRLFLLYVSCFYIIAYVITIKFFNYTKITLDRPFYGFLLFMIILIQIVAYVINRFYKRIIYSKLAQYSSLMIKNDEISALYEEIMATEEELRHQNITLSNYTNEIQANQKRLEYLAYNDTLTGLPNRKYFMEQLDVLLDISDENSHSFAVVFIDIDHFKRINDSMGHAAGDILLIEVADRLLKRIDHKDILGRIGGDELAMLIRRKISNELLLAYIEELVELFNEPFYLDQYATRVTASFGISIWPQDGNTAEDLLKAADVAMYKAKELGRNTIQFFRSEMKNEVMSRIQIENRLVKAIDNNELYLEYQPVFDATSNAVVSFEALLRWNIPEYGKVSPAVFIPFAEDTGIIHRFGEWVIEQACAKINEMKHVYNKEIVIAINVSPLQIKDKLFIKKIKKIIDNAQIQTHSLEFEITESVFIHNMDQAIQILESLRSLGIKIAMDDFGTGYSSLSYLMKLPIDTLKIDKSFINEIEKDHKRNNLIGSIISMAHSLDLKVVAEGVETEIQLEFLKKESCNYIQGYLLSRPLNQEQLTTFIEANL